ncbi:hypothetical protein MKZ38_002126 [Zalerion maritima]|uniref:Glutamine synthetase n=1 Tax=Zalerion maritima TaxID=339359 RepID=A0AAD5RPD3_9PEZI|nr:hypothetical protein MKZ38_002126 [Zalerion maritima]
MTSLRHPQSRESKCIASLCAAIDRCPIIDNHAHPLLRPSALSRHPLMSLTTEASDDAIHSTWSSLAHIRATKQLATVLQCDPNWESVVNCIEKKRFEFAEDWVVQCLEGIESILIDDGLDGEDDAYEYDWHDSFTRSKCKRIVRIEKVAQDLIDAHLKEVSEEEDGKPSFEAIIANFEEHINKAIADPEVVAFKSVICYRTGLDIPREPDEEAAKAIFEQISADYKTMGGGFKRLEHAALNSLLVHRTAFLIQESESQSKKPLQFHTGLGDNDITLNKASPSHLQDFIKEHPKCPIVLLHASYPFTREAGYLASVYSNVYADIGEVFPCLSQDGQEQVVRQILELCPWSKVMWSTDGHWFPETYLLAVKQIREVLKTVMCEYVQKEAVGWKAAIRLSRDVLFNNANKLYDLFIPFTELYEDEDITPATHHRSDYEILDAFLKGRPTPQFLRIYWNDYTSCPRTRVVPFRRVMSMLEQDAPVTLGITKASLALLQNDSSIPGVAPTGEWRIHPDFSSLREGPVMGHVSTYGDFREQDGSKVTICPRTLLAQIVEDASDAGLTFLLGFEIEFVVLRRDDENAGPRFKSLPPNGHAWSLSRPLADTTVMKLLSDIVEELERIDVFVEQLHSESAPGQYEICLPPQTPLAAIDTVLHVREVISNLAANWDYRVTLHPKPFPNSPGTASHVHMSITSPGGGDKALYNSFYAGILKHMGSITAFTYANPTSYDRMGDSVWAGGRWVAWGTQNRETALRKIENSHWELKILDGTANPYLALAAILAMGTKGVVDEEELVWGDCEMDPAGLTENDRKELNVMDMLPASLEEAIEALKKDEIMQGTLGEEVVDRYVAVKEAEMKMYETMGTEQMREWVLERY